MSSSATLAIPAKERLSNAFKGDTALAKCRKESSVTFERDVHSIEDNVRPDMHKDRLVIANIISWSRADQE